MKTGIFSNRRLIPFFIVITLLVIASLNFPFFWDKDVLNSRQAFWYLNHGFKLIAPPGLDPGHPPIMGLLLAALWKIFGIHLWVGHLAMLPFAIGLVWQLYRFIGYFIHSNRVYAALILVLADTSILTQMIILTGDLLTLFFFFLVINAILYHKRGLLSVSLVFLAISSSRGMISCVAAGLFEVFLLFETEGRKNIVRNIWKNFMYYIPAILIAGGYLIWHYYKTGWIGYDKNDHNWAPLFEKVVFKGFLMNIFLVGWRLADFGRLFLYLAGLWFLIKISRGKIIIDQSIRIIFSLFLISLMVFAASMLPFKGLMSHRYLLPVYAIFSTLIAYLIFEKIKERKTRRILFILLLIGILSGNFWVYPDNIAKGWDATLAHIPYYTVRKKMITYLDKQNIPFDSVGSGVPNLYEIRFIDLNNDHRRFPKKNFARDQYIFYSNIYNMFTDKELYELKHRWIRVKEFRLLQVRATLYKRPG